MSEEVDEINEYLKARRQKQELGELPKTDLAPPFVSRLSRALFGEKQKAKVPLQSMQPTYVSPQAQNAVRQQLDEIMRARQQSTPPKPTVSPRPSTPTKPLTSPPHYPNYRAPANAPSVPAPLSVSVPPRPSSPSPIPPKPSSPFLGFWKKQLPIPVVPTAASSSPARPATSPSTTTSSSPTPTRTAPFSPYSEIPSLSTQKSTREASSPSPIPPVKISPSSPAPTSTPARTAYAPPWVTRMQPKEGDISPPLNRTTTPPYAISLRTENSSPVPSPVALAPVPSLLSEKKEERVVQRGGVDTTLPAVARDEPSSFFTPHEKSTDVASGEVRVEELKQSPRSISQPLPSPASDSLKEEISEEEAIEKLPFEEVEGLSASDLAYLEQKEKEHAQSHDEEWDQSNPAALKAKLEAQENPLVASPSDLPPSDPKKDILRRLKKMMAEEGKDPTIN